MSWLLAVQSSVNLTVISTFAVFIGIGLLDVYLKRERYTTKLM